MHKHHSCRFLVRRFFCELFLFSLLTVSLTACSTVQGYAGPKLPDDQVAQVELDFNSAELDVGEAKIDGYSFGSTFFGSATMAVLPGRHQCSASFAVKGEEYDCRVHHELDSSGFSQCKKEQRKSSNQSCDCMDYLILEKRCLQTLYDLNCAGSFLVSAGKKYLFELSGDDANGSARVVVDGGGDVIATTNCSSRGRRVQSTTSSLGRGRSTANYNGIYSCNPYFGF